MTKLHLMRLLVEWAGDLMAASSIGLIVYRTRAKKIFLRWIPRSDKHRVVVFWTIMDNLEETFHIIAGNSEADDAKHARAFVDAAEVTLHPSQFNAVNDQAKTK